MAKTTSWDGVHSWDGYDAVVIGSGYGGPVAAYRMAMAGIKVCLLEKGRRWNAEDFPRNTFQLASLSSLNVAYGKLGLNFGPKDGLFQVHLQHDSMAVVACGLGGGSLINAGVITSTPIRAKRNPKWPKEWQQDWDVCEESALAMLKPQSIPMEFDSVKIMKEISDDIEESKASSVRVSVNFNHEVEPNSTGSQPLNKCLACGNCVSGCPYNAKISTDKSYVEAAIQAGCEVITECEVKYVVKNSVEDDKECDGISGKQNRRWRVYINDFECIQCDFVVIAAGVLGTSRILFESESRGLRLSEKLGFGFSTNGNNVAVLAGSSAPLNAYGMNKNQLSNIPYQDRPGPSISASFTSSLGYTVQGAAIPTAYPLLLFKGIGTYGWPNRYWLLHGVIDNLKLMTMGSKASQAMALNIMGHDSADGRIMFNRATNKLRFIPAKDPLLTRKIQALQKLAKRLQGILFMSRLRSTSVHLLGGCIAASDPSNGVCNPSGQVFDPNGSSNAVHPGLYVCDASLIPCSVGINPCLTITAAAEHVSRHLVQDVLKYKTMKHPIHVTIAEPAPHDLKFKSDEELRSSNKVSMARRDDRTVFFEEALRGYVGGMPCTAYLTLKLNPEGLKDCDEGSANFGGPHHLLRGKVGGYVSFQSVHKDKLYIVDGEADLCSIDSRTPYTQYMRYHMILASASGSRYILEGRKIMHPFLQATYAWKESTTLHVTFKSIYQADNADLNRRGNSREESVDLKGKLHISFFDLLRTLISMRGSQRGNFVGLLLQSFYRTYIMQTPRSIHEDFSHIEVDQKAYPTSIHHEITTGDGFLISCKQWKCNTYNRNSDGGRALCPVLLINGYLADCYYLPTEPRDLVRILLEEGHETWILQSRLHPLNPANDFTFDDIAKFDIPAVLAKISELHGPSVKVHVVGHCVGGLSIHMALLGGHISASQVASVSCTNSSMFFKLNTLTLVKLWPPLLPVAMAMLGKNRILSFVGNSKDSFVHHLIKSVFKLMPRYERCTCEKCEVFSGIFGNAFWHENVSPTMHHWHNTWPRLPMGAFTHLRKIILAGHIVDSNGHNTYLIHPERIALPTLYISGGRTLLVTPHTSFVANQYMRLHQPGFNHKRVVVDGFGHSDLLIGEESHKKVFPHMLSHMKLAEQPGDGSVNTEETKFCKESSPWTGSSDGGKGFGLWIFFILICIFSAIIGFFI